MKKYLLFLSLFILIFSCKKSDKSTGNNPPVETKITYTVDSSNIQPGLFLTLTASTPISKDTCTVQLSEKSVLLTKIDSFHFAFLVPVLDPGTYMLDLKNLNAENNPQVVIRNYNVISNPDSIFTAVTNDYNKLADSLEANSPFNANAATDATFLRQLTLQFNQNVTQCTAEQKLLLAYQAQNMRPDVTLFQKADIDTNYIAARITGSDDDISNLGIALSVNFTKKEIKAFSTAGTVVIACAIAVIAPFPGDAVAALSALIALKAYFASTKDAEEALGEQTSTTFIAVDMSETDGSGTSADPIQANNSLPLWIRYIATYRTIQQSDESGSNSVIATAIKAAYELQIKDQSIKSIYDNIKNKLASFFNSVTTPYSSFVSTVLTTAKEKSEKIKNKFISVTNVSNPVISVTAVDDGDNGLKLTFSNPGNNISTATDFSFQLSYTQEPINNSVTITEQGKFTPGATISLVGSTYSLVSYRFQSVPGEVNININSCTNPPYWTYQGNITLFFNSDNTYIESVYDSTGLAWSQQFSYSIGAYYPDSLFVGDPRYNCSNSYGHQYPEGWGEKLPPGYNLDFGEYWPTRLSKDGNQIYRAQDGDHVYIKQ